MTAALGLGNALLAAGRDLDASRAFERALAIQPSLPAASYGYARSMIAIQRPEVAVEHLRKLVAQAPSSVEALNALGVAQDLLGDHAAAADTYRQALAVVPASASVRNNLALSLALQERYADAVDLLRPLAEGPGATRRARQNLALIYGLQGDMGAAERISRVDLGGQDLANNLAYFAAVRGIEAPTVRAATLSPEQALLDAEPRLTRNSKTVRRAARLQTPDMVPSSTPQPRHTGRAADRASPAGSDPWHRWRGCRRPARHGSSMSAATRRRQQSNVGRVFAPSTVRPSPASAGSPVPAAAWSHFWSARSRASRRRRACVSNSPAIFMAAGRCNCRPTPFALSPPVGS